MNKISVISDFLDYGGNELFSSLMNNDMNRSDGIDRLIQLLKMYSDCCRKIKGRSNAYRYMLLRAEKLGWLGRESINLKSHRLTQTEREHIEKQVCTYILRGGRKAIVLKTASIVCILMISVSAFTYMIWNHVSSEKYQVQMNEFYKEQIIIENEKSTSGVITFSIKTTSNIDNFVYMEHMPTLFYVSADGETEINVLPENDICNTVKSDGSNTEYAQDPRSLYSCEPNMLYLSGDDYGITFLPGKYRVEFSFYIYNDDTEKVYLPVVSKEIIVN